MQPPPKGAWSDAVANHSHHAEVTGRIAQSQGGSRKWFLGRMQKRYERIHSATPQLLLGWPGWIKDTRGSHHAEVARLHKAKVAKVLGCRKDKGSSVVQYPKAWMSWQIVCIILAEVAGGNYRGPRPAEGGSRLAGEAR